MYHWQRSGLKKSKSLFIVFLGLALCLLVSACDLPGSTSQSLKAQSPASTPTPGITASLKSQGDAQLQTFQDWLSLLKQYGGETSSYQQQYNADQQALQKAQTVAQYNVALSTTSSHVEAIKLPAIKNEALNLYNQLNSQVTSYGQQHTYHDDYNNSTYPLGYGYDNKTGILGSLWTASDLQKAKTVADYQQIIEDLNMYTFNFQEMEKNTADKTPSDQVHQTDLELLKHYGKTKGKALVISLNEQTLRVYNGSQLTKVIQVTTGQPDLPSPPGTWWVEGQEHNVTFKSTAPKDSPEWYPDTPIHEAMAYHSNGYFLHDAWWRNDFGPGTEFPHVDPSGLEGSGVGSHGCVNMSQDNATWLNHYVQLYTPVILY